MVRVLYDVGWGIGVYDMLGESLPASGACRGTSHSDPMRRSEFLIWFMGFFGVLVGHAGVSLFGSSFS
jgi:hypothetical protein